MVCPITQGDHKQTGYGTVKTAPVFCGYGTVKS